MKKLTLTILVAAFLFGCTNQTPGKKSPDETNQTTKNDDSQIGRHNFAVVWNWKTNDKQLMDKYLLSVSDEMNELWKNDVIENIYFHSDASKESGYFPNISFFLKAKSQKKAENILNDLILVKKGLADYKIYPVGAKWLGRATEAIHNKGVTGSFVAVWTTPKKIDPDTDSEVIMAQADAIMKLYKAGVIENVYFDVEGTQTANNITDFVFFINTKTKDEAKKICDNLPFSLKKKATYKLQDVGVFWLGEHP